MAVWHLCFENCSPNIYGCPHIIATEKWKPHSLLKNIPHLYAKKWGFGKVLWRIIYGLFIEIALENKNAPFGAK